MSLKNASKPFVLLPAPQHVGTFEWHILCLFLDCDFHLCLDQLFFCWQRFMEESASENGKGSYNNTSQDKNYCTHLCSNTEYTALFGSGLLISAYFLRESLLNFIGVFRARCTSNLDMTCPTNLKWFEFECGFLCLCDFQIVQFFVQCNS